MGESIRANEQYKQCWVGGKKVEEGKMIQRKGES